MWERRRERGLVALGSSGADTVEYSVHPNPFTVEYSLQLPLAAEACYCHWLQRPATATGWRAVAVCAVCCSGSVQCAVMVTGRLVVLVLLALVVLVCVLVYSQILWQRIQVGRIAPFGKVMAAGETAREILCGFPFSLTSEILNNGLKLRDKFEFTTFRHQFQIHLFVQCPQYFFLAVPSRRY